MRHSRLDVLLRSLARKEPCSDLGLDAAATSWAINGGLAPLILAKGSWSERTVDESVLAADLTARVMTGALVDAMKDILDAAGSKSSSITLLKGISTCMTLYDQPHQRAMGDIDILVELSNQAWFEGLLYGIGYRQRSSLPAEFYARHCHSMPFFHENLPVCIEVHTALFPEHMDVARAKVFQMPYVFEQRQSGTFLGRDVCHLRPELQIAYVATHMAERLTFNREPFAFIDLILLLMRYRREIDWDRLIDSTACNTAANHALALLSHVSVNEYAPVPDEALRRFRQMPGHMNRFNLRLVHGIIDRYLLSPPRFRGLTTDYTLRICWDTLMQYGSPLLNLARVPWNVVFIPKHPERYSPRFHWWRLRSWLFGQRRHHI